MYQDWFMMPKAYMQLASLWMIVPNALDLVRKLQVLNFGIKGSVEEAIRVLEEAEFTVLKDRFPKNTLMVNMDEPEVAGILDLLKLNLCHLLMFEDLMKERDYDAAIKLHTECVDNILLAVNRLQMHVMNVKYIHNRGLWETRFSMVWDGYV